MPTNPATMSDRELDAACAVIAGHRVTPNVPCMYECGTNPCDMGLTDTLHRKLLPSDDDCYDPVPHYTSDWNAAMSLLDVVRGWPVEKQRPFCESLSRQGAGITPRIIAECVYAAHGAG